MRGLGAALALAWALLLAPVAAQTTAADGAALCDIYSQQTATVMSRLANWCPGSAPYDPCSTTPGAWWGVTCATVGGASRVVYLYLQSKGLTGSLPTSIGNLGAHGGARPAAVGAAEAERRARGQQQAAWRAGSA